ncbi:MAG: acetyltransferase [Rhodospirillaceae bacterium]|nr:acetyltransferase [Rhodospirillaceae bacterium]|tara:strand:+ start:19887 stop:20456 length:570 start_codon:yes stop_codon:yes gene_type:complete
MNKENKEKLILELQNVYKKIDNSLMQNFDRSLSFQDGMFDRWERAKRLGFSDGASIYNSSLVYGNVEVDKNTWIGPYTILDGSGGGITIGQFCSISAGVHIYTHDTVMWALSGGIKKRKIGSVIIGNNTYVGSKTVITLGVTLGSRCLIGAGSLVNKSFPDNSIILGTPAKKVGTVKLDKNDEVILEYD